MAYTSLGNTAAAGASMQSALSLARELADRQGQADLHWDLAIHFAGLGDPEQAIAHGQAAVDVLQAMKNPTAKAYGDFLARFRQGAANGLGSPTDFAAGIIPEETAAAGPGLLRMAISVAKSVAKQVGCGLKTVSPQTYQRRVQTCAGCEHFTGVRCRVCGCFTQIKARLPHERCPLEKWPA